MFSEFLAVFANLFRVENVVTSRSVAFCAVKLSRCLIIRHWVTSALVGSLPSERSHANTTFRVSAPQAGGPGF